MFCIPDLQQLYNMPYDESLLEWRRLGAADKAAHIQIMLGPQLAEAKSVLEVGCGTGDVSAILARLHPKVQFYGVEIGEPRKKIDLRLGKIENLTIDGYDGAILPYDGASFDIVFATHVLEHVVNERAFLHELRRVTRGCVFVEVPCEQVLSLNPARLQRTLDIGHINCYSVESFGLKLETSGLKVEQMRIFDSSRAVQTFRRGRTAILKFAIRRLMLNLAPSLAPKFLSYHVAAVAVPAPKLNIG